MVNTPIGYRFNGYKLDITKKKLSNSHAVIPLTAKAFRLLHTLADSSPNHIGKHQLIDEIWADRNVSETSLIKLVSETRTKLEDSGDKQSIISTDKGISYSIPDATPIYENQSKHTNGLIVKIVSASIFVTVILAWQMY